VLALPRGMVERSRTLWAYSTWVRALFMARADAAASLQQQPWRSAIRSMSAVASHVGDKHSALLPQFL